MKYQLVIFDADGTLADSFPWFSKVLNTVADKFRFRRVEPGEVEALRGCDARQILERLDVPGWKVPMIARHMRALKAQHLHEISLFPGIDRMLQELARTNTQFIRLISHARLNAARGEAEALERALHGQIVVSEN